MPMKRDEGPAFGVREKTADPSLRSDFALRLRSGPALRAQVLACSEQRSEAKLSNGPQNSSSLTPPLFFI
jgi:hypothetical protein